MKASDLPGNRARGRRGHPHAFGDAQGAPSRCRPIASRPCARRGRRSRRGDSRRRDRARPGRSRRRGHPGRAGCRDFRAAGTARHRACRARRQSGDRRKALMMFWSSMATPRSFGPRRCARLRRPLAEGAALAVLGFRPADPTGYGRLIMAGGELVAIREEADASADERKIRLCNGGIMAMAGPTALAILERIGNDNRKGEFYLTDAVAIARGMKLTSVAIETEEDDVRGINTKAQLAEAEAVAQRRLRQSALEARRHADRAGNRSSLRRHQIRARRGGGTLCGVRRKGGGRGRRRHSLVLASCRRPCRQECLGRTVCQAAARRQARRRLPHRQFCRGQGSGDRSRRQGQSPELYRRRPCRRQRQYRRRHHHLQLRRQRTSIAP